MAGSGLLKLEGTATRLFPELEDCDRRVICLRFPVVGRALIVVPGTEQTEANAQIQSEPLGYAPVILEVRLR
jgi:hypothetical protein